MATVNVSHLNMGEWILEDLQITVLLSRTLLIIA